ncbi:MAG: YceI family protein [Sphingobacteriaceae bacterium]|jgi:polyisoprenoid-binding protein YceI
MKKLVLSLASVAIISFGTFAQTNWKIDNSHSKLGFSVTHLMVSETEGKFKIYEGTVSSKSDLDFTDASIDFSVDVNSINTDDEKRDGHLKSPDFFDAANHPKITFKATSMKPTKVKTTYVLEGDLTMRGVTKKVKLTAIGTSKTVKDPWGNVKYAFKILGKVNRKDFGLNWNAAIENGVVVGEEVKIDITVELNKAQ